MNYREYGTGHTVVLIHGFPMNQQVWTDFAEKLSESFHVVTIDLPGFGKSPALPDGFTIADVSARVLEFCNERNYQAPVIVGHSLGGYVALSLTEQRPDLPSGLCLFHSTALADSEEKRQSRNKVLEFVARQGVHAFTSNFIGPLYADPQHSSITKVKNIAVQSPRETVEAYTIAMRDRKDTRHVVRSFRKPLLFIAGEKDPGIPPHTIQEIASSNKLAEVLLLPDAGHMGMFESEGTCLKKISDFVEKCAVTFSGATG